jgi:protein-disulfide isomerase
VLEEYGDKVRFVFKHNPLSFHDKAQLASEASLEAFAQGKFWEYHDKLFENQQMLDRPNLEAFAEELGLDMAQFRTALDDGRHKAHIKADQAEAAAVKASGTPTFFVNGKKLEGGNSIDNFKAIIDAELEEVQKLVDKGTAAADVYEKVTKDGKIFKALDDAVHTFTADGSPMIGKAPAKITIYEFSEFQ